MKRTATGEAKKQQFIKKYAKLDESIASKDVTPDYEEFMQNLAAQRQCAAENVSQFRFNKKRVRVLSKTTSDVKTDCAGILYWMLRDMRVQDNWAFLFAQKLALKLKLPLLVACAHPQPFLSATLRHHKFYLDGLQQVQLECLKLKIPFYLMLGAAQQQIPELVRAQNIGAVVSDFHALRQPRACVDEVCKRLPADVAFTEVDAHNIVPVWITSDKQEYAARTIRTKITNKLSEYLTEFPALVEHPYAEAAQLEDCAKIDWQQALESQQFDEEVKPVDWAKPGYTAAIMQLQTFLKRRLPHYAEKRNDPTSGMLSMMSPWFRFGQISVQRCILEVSRHKAKYKASVEAFCEEAIVRRELSDNFCFYNKQYDSLIGAADWAQKTLNDHSKDKREWVYTLEEFEKARTHEDLWNAAQIQLCREGKMHGFLRMYWAKKILEWSESAQKALEIAIYLNDKYALDGSDPNGFVGCMWSIAGIHDQGWAERAVFGKIRYMNYQGCKRKFDVNAFVIRYGAQSYNNKK